MSFCSRTVPVKHPHQPITYADMLQPLPSDLAPKFVKACAEQIASDAALNDRGTKAKEGNQSRQKTVCCTHAASVKGKINHESKRTSCQKVQEPLPFRIPRMEGLPGIRFKSKLGEVVVIRQPVAAAAVMIFKKPKPARTQPRHQQHMPLPININRPVYIAIKPTPASGHKEATNVFMSGALPSSPHHEQALQAIDTSCDRVSKSTMVVEKRSLVPKAEKDTKGFSRGRELSPHPLSHVTAHSISRELHVVEVGQPFAAALSMPSPALFTSVQDCGTQSGISSYRRPTVENEHSLSPTQPLPQVGIFSNDYASAPNPYTPQAYDWATLSACSSLQRDVTPSQRSRRSPLSVDSPIFPTSVQAWPAEAWPAYTTVPPSPRVHIGPSAMPSHRSSRQSQTPTSMGSTTFLVNAWPPEPWPVYTTASPLQRVHSEASAMPSYPSSRHSPTLHLEEASRSRPVLSKAWQMRPNSVQTLQERTGETLPMYDHEPPISPGQGYQAATTYKPRPAVVHPTPRPAFRIPDAEDWISSYDQQQLTRRASSSGCDGSFVGTSQSLRQGSYLVMYYGRGHQQQQQQQPHRTDSRFTCEPPSCGARSEMSSRTYPRSPHTQYSWM